MRLSMNALATLVEETETHVCHRLSDMQAQRDSGHRVPPASGKVLNRSLVS